MMKAISKLMILLMSVLAVCAGPVRKLQAPIENFGEDPEPVSGRYPLRECQGDCDKNEHVSYYKRHSIPRIVGIIIVLLINTCCCFVSDSCFFL
jgi:hypothetical protein